MKLTKSTAACRPRVTDAGITLALAAITLSTAGAAEAAEGWYGGVDVGVSVEGSADISANAPLGGDTSLDAAVLGAAALGYARGDGWRFELELSRRENDLDGALVDPGSSVGATAVLANLYHDFGHGRVVPYVGLGLGMAEVDLQATYSLPLIPGSVDETDVTFAYQVGGGVAVRLSSKLDLDIGYRYFAAPGFEGTGLATSGGSPAPPSVPVPVDADVSQHALLVGLRLSF